MKKYIFFGLLGILAVAYSCTKQTAGDAAMKYAECLQKGNYAEFVKGIQFNPSYSEATTDSMRMEIQSVYEEKVAKEYAAAGGIKDIAILNESTNADNKHAEVTLQFTYGNDSTSEEVMHMVRCDDKKWRLDMEIK